MGLMSRASGKANFLPDIRREEAWQTFAGMFNQGKSPLTGRSGLSGLTVVRSRSDGTELDLGDEFSASNGVYHLRITGCSPPDYLEYEIRVTDSDILERREISIDDSSKILSLEFDLTIEYQRLSLVIVLLVIRDCLLSFGRPAVGHLRTLLSTKGRADTSFFQQWTRLPIDYNSVVVR